MRTFNIPLIVVSNVYGENDNVIGTKYIDDTISVASVNEFLDKIDDYIRDNQSIILYRQDIKNFANKIEDYHEVSNIFKYIKCKLRLNYTVFKLRHNPRTLEFYGINTAFIIHKNNS